MNRPAVLAFNPAGAAIARRAADCVGGDALGLASRVEGLDGSFEDAEAQVRELFRAGRPIIGVCASGILIRQAYAIGLHRDPNIGKSSVVSGS